MVTIIFESHSTTFDNENHLASGWNDVDLSPLGIDQSNELGDRYHGKHLDAIFIADLVRAYHTAEIAFYGKGIPIIQDKRLRECDYGDFTQKPSSIVDPEKPKRIHTPFPNGESYEQTNERMKSFLQGLLEFYDGKTVMIIGHRATQYALESLILGKPLEEVIPAPWKWQPGWTYYLEKI
jgi:broad specificity phosphatase PhoE